MWGRRNDLSTEIDDIGSVSRQRMSNKIQKLNEGKSGLNERDSENFLNK